MPVASPPSPGGEGSVHRVGRGQPVENAGRRPPVRDRCAAVGWSGWSGWGSESPDVLGLRALGAGDDVELDGLVVLEETKKTKDER